MDELKSCRENENQLETQNCGFTRSLLTQKHQLISVCLITTPGVGPLILNPKKKSLFLKGVLTSYVMSFYSQVIPTANHNSFASAVTRDAFYSIIDMAFSKENFNVLHCALHPVANERRALWKIMLFAHIRNFNFLPFVMSILTIILPIFYNGKSLDNHVGSTLRWNVLWQKEWMEMSAKFGSDGDGCSLLPVSTNSTELRIPDTRNGPVFVTFLVKYYCKDVGQNLRFQWECEWLIYPPECD